MTEDTQKTEKQVRADAALQSMARYLHIVPKDTVLVLQRASLLLLDLQDVLADRGAELHESMTRKGKQQPYVKSSKGLSTTAEALIAALGDRLPTAETLNEDLVVEEELPAYLTENTVPDEAPQDEENGGEA